MTALFSRLFLSVCVVCFSAAFATARDFPVSTADQVVDALRDAEGGDRIILAPGYYGSLNIGGKKGNGLHFGSVVEIVSQSAVDKAVIARLDLANVSNVKFENLLFDYTYTSGDAPSLRSVNVLMSDGITFANCIFDGDVAIGTDTFADGYGSGIALAVTHSKSVVVEHSKFYNWLRAGVFSFIENLTIRNNEVTSIRSDGFDFAAIAGAVIENNHMHDFRLAPNSPDHWDMIQFWTNGTKVPSTDILIRNNFLDSGLGGGTQSIFMRNDQVDRGLMGDEMYYRNIRIEGNLIRNAHSNAIVVGEAKSLTITRNTLLQAMTVAEGGKVSVPNIRVAEAAVGVEISNNIFPKTPRLFKTPPPGWKISGNVEVQRDDSTAANYYGDNFVNALADKSMTVTDLAILPGSPKARTSIGSPLAELDETPDAPMCIIVNGRGDEAVLQQTLQLRQAFGPAGALDLSAAVVSWSFGDGETATGLVASHLYHGAGKYKVSAKLKLPGHDGFSCERSIIVGREIAPD